MQLRLLCSHTWVSEYMECSHRSSVCFSCLQCCSRAFSPGPWESSSHPSVWDSAAFSTLESRWSNFYLSGSAEASEVTITLINDLGAIAFALSLQIKPSLSPNSGLLVSSTLVVVLITTLIFGGLMSIFTKLIGLKEETVTSSNLDYSHLMKED